jgi:hypothetical protein
LTIQAKEKRKRKKNGEAMGEGQQGPQKAGNYKTAREDPGFWEEILL